MTAEPPASLDQEVYFVGDPMCSWCWGFAPVLDNIADICADNARLTYIVGGLRSADTPMTARDKEFVRDHWRHVQEATGQPFDFAFFDRTDFVYDTEPACRAIVLVRTAQPDQVGSYFRAVQEAFYAQNQDVTDPEVLSDLAEDHGIPRTTFLAAFEESKMRDATLADFHFSRRLGVAGFPTVLCRKGEDWAYLTVGYRPIHAIEPALRHWLDSDK